MAKQKRPPQQSPGKAIAVADRRMRFAEAYARLGDIVKAAAEAGIGRTPATQKTEGAKLLRDPIVIERLREITEATREAGVANALERQRFLTLVMRGQITEQRVSPAGVEEVPPSVADRIRAAVELGKLQGDYIERHQVTHQHYVAALPAPTADPAAWAKAVQAEVTRTEPTKR